MDNANIRAARVAGRTFSSDGGGAPIDWSRPAYGYLALALATLAVTVVGFGCLG